MKNHSKNLSTFLVATTALLGALCFTFTAQGAELCGNIFQPASTFDKNNWQYARIKSWDGPTVKLNSGEQVSEQAAARLIELRSLRPVATGSGQFQMNETTVRLGVLHTKKEVSQKEAERQNGLGALPGIQIFKDVGLIVVDFETGVRLPLIPLHLPFRAIKDPAFTLQSQVWTDGSGALLIQMNIPGNRVNESSVNNYFFFELEMVPQPEHFGAALR